MNSAVVFNITICIIGVLLLTIHIVNILLKNGNRKDEKNLLVFFVFTALHFAIYLVFTLIKMNYSSNTYIIASYTIFLYNE